MPLSTACPAASASTRVLPTPASPATIRARASPARARSNTWVRRASSSSRPMNGVVDDGVVNAVVGTEPSWHAPLTLKTARQLLSPAPGRG